MSTIIGTQYVLAVPDLKRSVKFYVEELGCEVYSEPPGWAFLRRESFCLMLGECSQAIDPTQLGDHAYFAYVNTADAESLYQEILSKSVTIRKHLKAEPWGMKEFAIETVDGHRMMFGEQIQDPSI